VNATGILLVCVIIITIIVMQFCF